MSSVDFSLEIIFKNPLHAATILNALDNFKNKVNWLTYKTDPMVQDTIEVLRTLGIDGTAMLTKHGDFHIEELYIQDGVFHVSVTHGKSNGFAVFFDWFKCLTQMDVEYIWGDAVYELDGAQAIVCSLGEDIYQFWDSDCNSHPVDDKIRQHVPSGELTRDVFFTLCREGKVRKVTPNNDNDVQTDYPSFYL